ncbi:glycosyltransferase [Streptomyces sp. NPDC059070]|uniref:glycosyltransferase n=1 Tax=Streptomyces sp. NPDC059070 TaxID=3346713 RepID=UPI0036C37513
MALRVAITAEPVPSHVSALDYVIGPSLEQGHRLALHAPLMFRREARLRGVDFHRAGTNWTCAPGVQQTAGTVWKRYGNGAFNRYVFGHLWTELAGRKAQDLLASWTRTRPDLVIAECSDFGAHLAARVLGLPLVAADNGLGPVLVDLWDSDIAPALSALHKQYELPAPALPPMVTPAPVDWFHETTPPGTRAVRRTVARFRTVLPDRLAPAPTARPLVYVSLGTLTTAMASLRTVVEGLYQEVMAALSATGCHAIVSAGELARHLRTTDSRITVVEHVPQPALLHHADLFVTHAGRGSLLDAVQGGTPVLAMGVLGDQPGNAAAFARLGLGQALDLTATRGEMADAITTVLGAPRYGAAVRAADAALSELPTFDPVESRDTLV